MDTILTGTQSRYRDSYAFSPQCGLVVRSNGEEQVQVINSNGAIYPAGINPPTVAPTVVSAGSGILPISQYMVYVYVYAAKAAFPLVNSPVAINGSLAPRSNQSPNSLPFQISATVPGQNTVTVTCSPLTWIDTIWIFRTNTFATSIEATTAATAGDCYFLGEVANIVGTGTTTFLDNYAFGTTAIELDNYVAPQFQYVTYYDPYYYGWGNNNFQAVCSYATTGIVTLTAGDTWFNGRNGQFATIASIVTGGVDGQGLFYFKWLTSTTAQLVDASGASLTLSASGTSTISIQGPSATLYRSKIQNPMGWGDTEQIAATTSGGSALRIPSLTAMRVGGGYGTAIAVVPDQALLKLDAEFPASCYTFNLQLAGTANFTATLKLVSNVFSVTANDSQYSAVNNNGRMVLRGMDYKNYSIIECDGLTQLPVSTPIPVILRKLTKNRARQLMTHGVYDPFTELNCMWVSTYDAVSIINLLIYEHAPTGFWGIVEDYDVLCSASVQDTFDGTTKTYLGTQSGFMGQGFVDGLFSNWLPSTGLMSGTMASATSNSFVRAGTVNFNISVGSGMIGNWCMITDPNGLNEQWGRIVGITVDTIYFDIIKNQTGSSTILFDPVPTAGWLFYIGMIDVRLLKYFDFNTPSTDKKVEEVWLTVKNHTNTGIRLYRERQSIPYVAMQVTANALTPDTSNSDAVFTRTKIPATLLKTVGLEVVDRSYADWQLANMVVKATLEP